MLHDVDSLKNLSQTLLWIMDCIVTDQLSCLPSFVRFMTDIARCHGVHRAKDHMHFLEQKNQIQVKPRFCVNTKAGRLPKSLSECYFELNDTRERANTCLTWTASGQWV
jgi:predicted alternative tryptophan synthase beta-subunit